MNVSQKSNTVLAALLQVKALPGSLYRLVAYNDKGSAQYVQVHDAAATPSAQTPLIVFKLAAAETRTLDFLDVAMTFSNGIFVGNSSTAATYTAGSADCYFFTQYL